MKPINTNLISFLTSQQLGDGSFEDNKAKRQSTTKKHRLYYSSIYREYNEYKNGILIDLLKQQRGFSLDNLTIATNERKQKSFGKYRFIRTDRTNYQSIFTKVLNMPLSSRIKQMSLRDLAIFLLDDGTASGNCYRICINRKRTKRITNALIDRLKDFGIYAKLSYLHENAWGNKHFNLIINFYNGGFLLSEEIKKMNLSCFQYKIIEKNNSAFLNFYNSLTEDEKQRNWREIKYEFTNYENQKFAA